MQGNAPDNDIFDTNCVDVRNAEYFDTISSNCMTKAIEYESLKIPLLNKMDKLPSVFCKLLQPSSQTGFSSI